MLALSIKQKLSRCQQIDQDMFRLKVDRQVQQRHGRHNAKVNLQPQAPFGSLVKHENRVAIPKSHVCQSRFQSQRVQSYKLL